MKEILYFVLGAAVGAAIALLLAPESGKELQAEIQAAAEKDLTKLQAEWHAAMGRTNERIDQIQADQKQALQQEASEAGGRSRQL